MNNKHYNALTNYYTKKFGKKVFKISLNANFSCPHKTPENDFQGCSFCSKMASGDFAGDIKLSLSEQFKTIKEKMHTKWKDGDYIAYFQANTNTYAPLEKLKEIYDHVHLFDEKIKMIAISTRADCLDDEKIAYFAKLNQTIPIQIELGLQTIHEKTAQFIHRCEELEYFQSIVDKLNQSKIETVIHIINGLPFETFEMMMETARFVAKSQVSGIKIHMLHILKDTKMALDYQNNPWPILSLEEYVDITIKQLQILPKEMIIHRLTGDAPKDLLITPKWTLKKFVVLNEIDKKMRKDNLYQAQFYNSSK